MAEKRAPMSALKAAEAVLSQAGEPLRAEEMTRRILEGGLWHTKGKTPDATLSAKLAVDIKSRGIASRFQRTKRGLFALRAWGHPEYVTSVGGVPPISASDNRAVASHRTTLTFKDAAAVVLERYAGKKPMNYHDIT